MNEQLGKETKHRVDRRKGVLHVCPCSVKQSQWTLHTHTGTHILMKCQMEGCQRHYTSLWLITCPTGSLADSLDWVTASSSESEETWPHNTSLTHTQPLVHIVLYTTQPEVSRTHRTETHIMQVCTGTRFSNSFRNSEVMQSGGIQIHLLIHFLSTPDMISIL